MWTGLVQVCVLMRRMSQARDRQVWANGVQEDDEDAADEASRVAHYLGSAPCAAQRVS